MIRQGLLIVLAYLLVGCVSTEPKKVAGCAALSPDGADSVFVPSVAGEHWESSWFDARLTSGRFAETDAGCLLEGVAPSRRVAEAQMNWIKASVSAICGGTSQSLPLQPLAAAGESGYRFAVRVSVDSGTSCEAGRSGEPATLGGVNPASRRMNPPRYPPVAVRQGLEGQVVVRIRVSAEGRADATLVIKSSGHPMLDDAALEAVDRWQFDPALTSTGEPVPLVLQVPIDFTLG